MDHNKTQKLPVENVGAKILVAANDQHICELLKAMLIAYTPNVVISSHPKEAITFVRKENFDFVLADFVMRGMDGVTMVKKMKNFKRDLAVIMMTDYDIQNILEGRMDIKEFLINNCKTIAQKSKKEAHDQIMNVIQKPLDLRKLGEVLRNAEENYFLRKTYLIRPRLQLMWAFLLGLQVMIGILVTVIGMVLTPMVINAFSHERLFVPYSILDTIALVWPWMILGTLFLFLYSALIGIFFSHRFVGPLYRIEDKIKDRLNGYPTGIVHIRKKDMLHDFTSHLNELFKAEDEIYDAAKKLVKKAEDIHEAIQNKGLPIDDSLKTQFYSSIQNLKKTLKVN